MIGRYKKLKEMLNRHKQELQEKYQIKTIGIFGSYVRGENKRGSDFDILVEFSEGAGMDLIKFIELENYISDFLGVKVDLVMKSALKPRIGRHILEEAVYL